MSAATIRRRATCALVAFALLAATSACTKVSDAPAAGARHAYTHPHELRMADVGEPTTLNPMLSTDAILVWLGALTMAYLVRFDHANRPIPELATTVPTLANGGISRDGKTITYHLRRNVRWSDGKPFDASDVTFTTYLILDPKVNVTTRDGYDRIVKVETPDDHTVVYHLREPYSPAVATFFATSQIAILPRHLLAGKDANTDAYNALPIGIGPFRYVRWARGDRIEMVANDTYWRGRPKLDRIVYRNIPDRETLFNALSTGDVDLWPFASSGYYPRLRQLPSVRVRREAGFAYNHLDFNVTHPVVADPRVRRALMLGWDRRLQRDTIGHHVGILQDSVISPKSPYFDPTIGFTRYDPQAANAMLDAAGWRRGADGVRVKNGVRLSLEFVSNTGSPDTDQRIELLRSDWKQIGVTFERKNVTSTLLFAPYANDGILERGKFDIVFLAWFVDPSGSVNNIFNCDQVPPAGNNVLHWCDAATSRALDDFQRTYDLARQKRDNVLVQRRVAAQTPTIVSTIGESLFAYNSDLTGFRPNAVTYFDDMMRVDI